MNLHWTHIHCKGDPGLPSISKEERETVHINTVVRVCFDFKKIMTTYKSSNEGNYSRVLGTDTGMYV